MNNQLGGTYKWEVGTIKRTLRTPLQDKKTHKISLRKSESIHNKFIPIGFHFYVLFQKEKSSGTNCKLKAKNHKNAYYGKQKKKINVSRIKDKDCFIRKDKES